MSLRWMFIALVCWLVVPVKRLICETAFSSTLFHYSTQNLLLRGKTALTSILTRGSQPFWLQGPPLHSTIFKGPPSTHKTLKFLSNKLFLSIMSSGKTFIIYKNGQILRNIYFYVFQGFFCLILKYWSPIGPLGSHLRTLVLPVPPVENHLSNPILPFSKQHKINQREYTICKQ